MPYKNGKKIPYGKGTKKQKPVKKKRMKRRVKKK